MASKVAAFHPDIVEWLVANKGLLRVLRKDRYALEKGFVGYFNDFRDFVRETRSTDSKEVKEVSETKEESSGSRSLSQYYESEELTKRMKWKRITWDENAEYKSFSRRVLDNDNMFKNVPAFSFLSIHVTKDEASTNSVSFPPLENTIEQGSLTNWVLKERDPVEVKVYLPNSKKNRQGAFTVDWISGEVKVIDTASAQEILTFLLTVAPRLQALQIRMEEQQTKIAEQVENVRIRVGAQVKFNLRDTSFWDDPMRKTSPDYIDPDETQRFLEGILKSAFFYRWFLKGQGIRIVPRGRPYYVDMENKEVQIPSNFVEYNWVGAHSGFEKLEGFFNKLRTFWWFWFSLTMVIVGDVELL